MLIGSLLYVQAIIMNIKKVRLLINNNLTLYKVYILLNKRFNTFQIGEILNYRIGIIFQEIYR